MKETGHHPSVVSAGAQSRRSAEPLAKPVSGSPDLDRRSGVQVHCGGCLHRAFDVYEEFGRLEYAAWGENWMSSGAVVERRCPGCRRLVSSPVTLEPGLPAPDGIDGPWLCDTCGTSLARIDAIAGKIKASCLKGACRQTVTVIAKSVLAGEYLSVDEERARRRPAVPVSR